ncbi:sodium-dependent transporter [Kroppenstedtia pulmonis]|uniref:Sodium-dependent transporter n=1 Tax=Kroppenstedtia pulmonis TaxID=1380685 RepID=A0A7D4CE97_9BACL|nr:sodium-dependent transporter [Kroppenstedtia pulmonis]QKG83714.1 sodium-dependent transporter [Kroppenstedtia pulmonis]
MKSTEQWGSRAGFILAALGSAIGLGNIWRYPYVAYENGGGAFLLPYFIALLTAGIPILLLEYSLGHKYRASAPLSYRRLSKKWEWIGWWQVFIAFVIVSYYMVIIGWALSYTYFSVGSQWGQNTEDFFYSYLGTTSEFWSIGGIEKNVVVPLLLVWIVVYLILLRGAKKGIEAASKILLPILAIAMIAITIRGVTLPGATEGLNVLLKPDFAALADPKVWVAAYGQVFFSLSIGMAIMITYSSYLPKKSDLANGSLIAGLGNASFEFMASLGIFSALGFLATQQGVAVDEVVASGIGLAFVVLPNIINEFPGFNSLFGVLFFGTLVFAGITSAISLLETGIAALKDKLDVSRTAAVNWVCGGAALLSLLYATKGGIRYLDTVDHFINNYGLLIAGFMEVLALSWFVKKLINLKGHINDVSDIRIGSWWNISLKWITPVVLIWMMVLNLKDELAAPYEDYPISGLIAMGWGLALALVVIAFILQATKWQDDEFLVSEQKES